MKWFVVYILLTGPLPQIQVVAETGTLETCLTMVKAHNKDNDMSRGYYKCLKL